MCDTFNSVPLLGFASPMGDVGCQNIVPVMNLLLCGGGAAPWEVGMVSFGEKCAPAVFNTFKSDGYKKEYGERGS